MDRSFLTDERVVEASREFVCMRLATYEDADEAEFLKNVFVSRSGELENTVFAILSPNGKEKLVRPNRGPFSFRNPGQLAAEMNKIAGEYESRQPQDSDSAGRKLPTMKNVELALNVAACDGLPLVIVYAPESASLARLNDKVAKVAWDDAVAGRFIYATTTQVADLKPVPKAQSRPGVIVVEPDQFGLSGSVLGQFAAELDARKLTRELETIASKFEPIVKNHREHTQLGIRLGLDWETVIPETDRQAIEAKKRARGGGN